MATIDQITAPSLTFEEDAAPATPASGKVIVYAKSDGKMYSKDDAGAETELGGGSGSSPLTTKGDIYGYSTTNARLPVGANNYVLTADSAQTLGVKWAMPNTADTPPGSANAKDDEFADTSLDEKWSWVYQGTATWVENSLFGVMSVPTQSGDTGRLLVQTVPAGDFEMTAKISLGARHANHFAFGLVLYNNSNGKRLIFGKGRKETYGTVIHGVKMTADTTWSSDPVLTEVCDDVPMYFKIALTSGTYYLSYSYDGINWIAVFNEAVSTFFSSITHIGLGFFRNNDDSYAHVGKCDWFRVTE